MPKKKRARFNAKKEVRVMAWIENDKGWFAKPLVKNYGRCLEAKSNGTNLSSVL
jgi:hypothetical protein